MDPHQRQLLKRLQSVLGLVVILVLAILVSPKNAAGDRIFLEVGNLTDILRQAAEIGVMALGMTLVILSAGIDLSVGSTLALSATVTAMVLTRWRPTFGRVMHILGRDCRCGWLACAAVGAINAS
jgi:ribose/xylose/arabinose/galactoside ABC-type transport system permease subunit